MFQPYAVRPDAFEVRLDSEEMPNDFDDVTFLVANCDNEQEAIKRVEAYVAQLVKEECVTAYGRQ